MFKLVWLDSNFLALADSVELSSDVLSFSLIVARTVQMCAIGFTFETFKMATVVQWSLLRTHARGAMSSSSSISEDSPCRGSDVRYICRGSKFFRWLEERVPSSGVAFVT
ncbi:hypothetical protein TNCV_3912851 [Trichonephila clavipes]|nr:hypothetical protein TNCV_3912851 [Trichonephila clavipes]